MTNRYVNRSETETIALGIELSRRLKRGDLVATYGDLGAGKTRFIKGICQGLGIREHVASPTFTIVNEYHIGDLPVYHFDFYRVQSMKEIADIGFDEYLNGDGICLIEWAEKAQPFLPPRRYDVHLSPGEGRESRIIVIEEIVAETA